MVRNHSSTPPHSADSSSYQLTDSIAKLSLSGRAHNALGRAGITTIGELVNHSEEQILDIRNVGMKTVNEIKMILESASLSLREAPLDGTPDASFRPLAGESIQVAEPIDTMGLPYDTTQALIAYDLVTVGSLLSTSLYSCMETQISSKAWAIIHEKCKRNLAWQDWNRDPRHTTQQGSTNLEDLGLGNRVLNALFRAGITNAGQVLTLSFAELVTIRHFGRGSVIELFDTLRKLRKEEVEWLLDCQLEEKPVALPPRIIRKLTRADIAEFSALSHYSRESLIADVGLSYKETIIIQMAMSNAGIGLNEQWPNEPLVKESDYRFLVRLGVPLDSIPIGRIALSCESEAQLKQLGYSQVGQLARESVLTLQSALGPRYSSGLPQIRNNLNQYFRWLSLQTSWESEINNEGLSPLYYRWLEEATVTEIVEKHLTKLTDREVEIIVQRKNLDGRGRRTLKEAGKSFGLSRERIRQLQQRSRTQLATIMSDRLCLAFLNLMHRAISRAGGLLPVHGLGEASEAYGVRLGHMDGPALIEFLLELDCRFKRDRTTGGWGIDGYPLEGIEFIISASKNILANAKAPIREDELLNSIKESLCSAGQATEPSDSFLLACWRASDELLHEDGWWRLESWTRRRLDNLIVVLRELGRSTHYTEIARLVNECVPENLQASERTIHAELGRHPDIFVWQESGTYGLAEWEYCPRAHQAEPGTGSRSP